MLIDEVVKLENPSDWETRPNYVKKIQATHDTIDRIIGKYELSRKVPMVQCGLNQCNTLHWDGLLISLKDGRETNIGNTCGEREFGERFSDIRAAFKEKEDAKIRAELLVNLLDKKTTLTKQAKELIQQCIESSVKIKNIKSKLEKHVGFWIEFVKITKLGGVILVDKKDPLNPEKNITVEMARVQQCQVLNQNGELHVNALKIQVVKWLEQELDQLVEAAGNDNKKLKKITDSIEDLGNTVRAAKTFIEESSAFCRPSNLAKLLIIEQECLSRRHKSNALSRALQQIQAIGNHSKHY